MDNLNFVLQTRGKLGLFDLNRFSEDFSKELLNIIYGYNLINLNSERNNEPGLDLGDEVKKLGIQVTTDKRTSKINHTLERITKEQMEKYDCFQILILGTKQKTYPTLNQELVGHLKFNENNILDFHDIEKDIISLPTEEVKKVHGFLSDNLIRIYSDLNVDETPSGEETNLEAYIEQIVTYSYTNCQDVINYIEEVQEVKYSAEDKQEIEEDYEKFYKALTCLPKITREFFYALALRASYISQDDALVVRDEIMRRVINLPPKRYNEELSLLESAELIDYHQEGAYTNLIIFNGLSSQNHCLLSIKEFAEYRGYNLSNILVDLNFKYLQSNI